MKFTSLVTLFSTLSILTLSCESKKDPPKRKADAPTIVDVLVASTQAVSNVLEVNGTVVANEYVELHPEVSGRLTYLNVPEGSFIRQGTLIARIYDADLEAQVAKSKVQLELAIKTEERLRKLLTIKGVNQADYDAAVNAVSSTRADIAYTEALITKTFIRAPFSGVVGLRQVSPGAFVTPATVIATIQQTSQLKIDFTLPEEYSNTIRRGANVDVQLDASKTTRSKATIIATEPKVDVNTRNLKVRAILQNAISNAGAFVKVFVNASRNAAAIMVPTNCIIPNDISNQLIVVKNGKANFVNVQTGIREANNVEITKGVNAGDSVVVTGVLFARQGSPLKIRSVKNYQSPINNTSE
jgi:membrane fusion protein (multidrug efflux system)